MACSHQPVQPMEAMKSNRPNIRISLSGWLEKGYRFYSENGIIYDADDLCAAKLTFGERVLAIVNQCNLSFEVTNIVECIESILVNLESEFTPRAQGDILRAP